MVDNNTLLVPESDTAVLTAALQALKVGAAKPTVLVVVTSYYVASPDGGRTTNLVVRDPESRVLILVDNVPLYQGL
jgi:hypothetical protein